MIAMNWTAGKFLVAAAALPLLLGSPAAAQQLIEHVSSLGDDQNFRNGCTVTQPCASIAAALLVNNQMGSAQIQCANAPGEIDSIAYGFMPSRILTIDCPSGYWKSTDDTPLVLNGPSTVVTIRHETFEGSGNGPAVAFTGSGTLILDDCVFKNTANAPGLSITPSGPLHLVVTNTRLSNNGSGMLIDPASGGSVTATFDHVTVTNNSGGGIKVQTDNGPVTLDITGSKITGNSGNGVNVVSGAGGAGMVSIGHSIISTNGVAGVQANGANAAVLIDKTLLDSNAGGATSTPSGGRILTYGTNRIVGAAGSGFTSSASLR
jgi:hypothetical protein